VFREPTGYENVWTGKSMEETMILFHGYTRWRVHHTNILFNHYCWFFLANQLEVEGELESGDARGEGARGVLVELAFARLDD